MKILGANHVSDADWDLVVRHAALGQFWHFASWRRYSMAYAGPSARDDSFAVHMGDRIEAVCPMIWEDGRYTMGGEPGPMPAAWSDTALIGALGHAAQQARARGVGLTFRLPPMRTVDPRSRPLLLAAGWTVDGWQTRIVQLGSAPSVLWRNLRKSYRALIHRTERTHRLVVSVGPALAADYMRLHQETVGAFMPRPDRTYREQADWLAAGQALLLGAQDRLTQRWDGFVYLFFHHDLAYFGSGPQRPGTDVMHGLLWSAILECRARGLQRFEVGWQGHASDDKGKAIEFHKRGYGGLDVPIETWTHA